MSGLPYDVTKLIREMATEDPSWDVHPPPIIGYSSSPLAAAVTISHVCTDWRMEILADEALWGRLLNTVYFPTFDDSLWWTVFWRAGDKPIWLRHYALTPPELCLSRLSEREMFAFRQMFLAVISMVPPHRIQRLELDAWHMDMLHYVPEYVKEKIIDAVQNHTTHLKLGNSLYAGALTGANSTGTPDDPNRYLRLGKSSSWFLIYLILGSHPERAMRRPLRQLHMYALSIDIQPLLGILATSPNLEELSLWISYDEPLALCFFSPSGIRPTIRLPRLLDFKIQSADGMALPPMARLRNATAYFDVEAKFDKYVCCATGGLYMIHKIEESTGPSSLR